MKRNTKHVCTECGHIEVRSLAPVECPNCGSDYVLDDEAYGDEMTEQDLTDLISYQLRVASNG